ncbi:hypothetical protein Amet_1477 [Alkaliphilus metalliredigens QYMF]|uniref:Uncharacterized protein n=1 Tax=Alkaliphilus metalliredigens (strain QYMF) TaxID=293826 RepID=A6TNA6_ALKMQ|nr:hypothetical protein [Alkaliphilus metalliredigens]ABR47674.1 hypothetical protein Amet_1477 [Alkaliphilus metalliredigens QYMF]
MNVSAYRTRVMSIIVLILVMASFSYTDAVGVPSDVYVTIDNERYEAQGSKIIKDNKVLADFSVWRSKNDGIDEVTAKSFIITDLAHQKHGEDDLIFAVGLAFKRNHVDFNDTSSYKNMQVNIGTPQLIIYSYNLSGRKDLYPYSASGVDIHLEGIKALKDVWASPFKSEFNEANEDTSFEYIYSFYKDLVHPRVIMSKYHRNLGYVLYGDGDDSDAVNNNSRHIHVTSISTARRPFRSIDDYSREQFFITFNYLENVAIKNQIPYKVDNSGFFMWEEDRNKLMLANKGDTHSIAVLVDISVYGRPRPLDHFWMDND